MPGPQETRLIQALDGARPGNVDTRAYEWSKCADILHTVSGRLDVAEMPVAAGEAGEKTAGAMNTAFKSAAAGMKERATKLRAGSQALAAAQTALDDAQSAHAALGAESARRRTPRARTPARRPGSSTTTTTSPSRPPTSPRSTTASGSRVSTPTASTRCSLTRRRR